MREKIETADAICQAYTACRRRDGLFWITQNREGAPEGYDVYMPKHLGVVGRMNLINLVNLNDCRVQFRFDVGDLL